MIKKDNNYLYWEQLSWGIQCGLSLDLNENVYSVVNHGVIFDNNDTWIIKGQVNIPGKQTINADLTRPRQNLSFHTGYATR